MAVQTESTANLFEQVYENLRKTAEANLQMQQDIFRKWATQWPSTAGTQMPFMEKLQKFQADWANTVTDLMRKHREVLDNQYRTSIESLEQAFRVAESKDPQEFRKRAEELCRKSLDMMRETAESGLREFQTATNKWIELATKATS